MNWFLGVYSLGWLAVFIAGCRQAARHERLVSGRANSTMSDVALNSAIWPWLIGKALVNYVRRKR